MNNSGFWYVRAKIMNILDEDQKRVKFCYTKDNITYTWWVIKSLLQKYDFAPFIKISIPKTWIDFEIFDTDGTKYKIKGVKELVEKLNFTWIYTKK